MSFFKQRIYLDYLDFQTGNFLSIQQRLSYKLQRLKFDILAFPCAQFFVAAPALAKCPDSMFLIAQSEMLWANNRVRYVLDSKYSGVFSDYVSDRIDRLSESFDEKKLLSHFEYKGYVLGNWRLFYDGYLSELELCNSAASRAKSADECFRKNVSAVISKPYFMESLSSIAPNNSDKILAAIAQYAENKFQFFQREAIVDGLQQLFHLPLSIIFFLNDELDLAFAKANADAANSICPNDFLGLNGRWLELISRHVWVNRKTNLYTYILCSKIEDLVKLSYQDYWRGFMRALDNEIIQRYHALEFDSVKLHRSIRSAFPSRYSRILIYLATSAVAYCISPFFGSGAASRFIGSVLNDAPAWIVNNILNIANSELTKIAMDSVERLPRIDVSMLGELSQKFMNQGFVYDYDFGYQKL